MGLTTKSNFYDDVNTQINRNHCPGEVGGAASTYYGKFALFAKTRLNAVNLVVTTVSTDANHKFDAYLGTTSVASVTVGTATVGSVKTITLQTTVDSMTVLSLRSGTATDGKAVASYEYRNQQDALYQE